MPSTLHPPAAPQHTPGRRARIPHACIASESRPMLVGPVERRTAYRAAVPRPRGRHPLPAPQPRPVRRPVTPGVLVAAGLLTAVVVIGMISLAHLRAADPAPAPVATVATAVVAVRDGETLSDVAARTAPDAPTSRVVSEIVSLNGLADSAVRAGQTLVVPVGAPR
ncbi:MAG TPA: LysM peptidoglycan-binding domain-containing protein [Aldersonia sp.]